MRIFGFIGFLVIAVTAARVAAAPADTLPPAVARIDAALENITKIARPGRVGYATIYDGNKYVQCRRMPDNAMRCEAAGSAMQPSLAAALTAGRVKALGALGWRLDPAFGNYVRVFASVTPTKEVAAHIARTLAEGYGSDPADLERATTWVEDVPCPPRNGPEQTLAGAVNDDPTMRRIRTCTLAAEAVAPETVDSAAALVARSGDTIAAEIERLRINTQRHVFVILDTGGGYVQCGPESATSLYCEAQSPQNSPALASVITPERLARLHAMGYADPGRATNYWKRYSLEKFSDAAIAAEILTVLHDVYGYAGATPLDIKTE